eukprot:jgi/Orpsp1_1/1183265/evm.model.c7180000084501.1
MAGGKIFGVSKKANIHMISVESTEISALKGMNFVKDHATPGKTVISISLGGGREYKKCEDDKLKELIDKGFIVIVAAGNGSSNGCPSENNKLFINYGGYRRAISVGATNVILDGSGYYVRNKSNYGDCVDIHSPGEVFYPNVFTNTYLVGGGTSSATPIVAGVAASIMSENRDIVFNNELMRKTLIDMSIKNAIKGLQSSDTPNRFVNNGKRSIYSPDDTNIFCGSSLNISCSDGCCTKNGECIKIENDSLNECLIENGCQSEFGYCTSETKSIEECENELKENKECLIENESFNEIKESLTDNSLFQQNEEKYLEILRAFNSDKCRTFYKKLYTNQSICSIAKKYKSFEFINTFNDEVYNEYNGISRDFNEKVGYSYRCYQELYEYNQCYIGSDINVVNFDAGMYSEKMLISDCNYYLINNCDDYHISNQEKNMEEIIPFSDKFTRDELIEKCNTGFSNECDFSIDMSYYSECIYHNRYNYKILETYFDDQRDNFRTICINNFEDNDDIKNQIIINSCEQKIRNKIDECTLDYYQEIDKEKIKNKCNKFNSNECQNIFEKVSKESNICFYAYNNKMFENLYWNYYYERYSFNNILCNVNKNKIIEECENEISYYKDCILNGQPSDKIDLQNHCMKFNNYKCQNLYERPKLSMISCYVEPDTISTDFYEEIITDSIFQMPTISIPTITKTLTITTTVANRSSTPKSITATPVLY